MDTEKYIGTDAAADFLSRSVITIRTWAARGFLPSYKIGGRRLFKASELDTWVRAQNPVGKRSKGLISFIDEGTEERT